MPVRPQRARGDEAQSGPALELDRVSKSFGAVAAVDDVSFAVERGSLTCLIGPNGAGKSTLLHCVSGFGRQDGGVVRLGSDDVSGLPAHRRAERGLATVFQTTRPLHELDVRANVMVGCHAWTRSGFATGILRLPRHRREERAIAAAADDALALVGLAERAGDPAETLPFGQLRLLAIARVLAARPSVLLLDEPVAGLRAGEKQHVVGVLERLRERGLTTLLVEHDMQFVGAVAERVLVLDRGRLIADGTPEEVRRDQRVVDVYLGTAA